MTGDRGFARTRVFAVSREPAKSAVVTAPGGRRYRRRVFGATTSSASPVMGRVHPHSSDGIDRDTRLRRSVAGDSEAAGRASADHSSAKPGCQVAMIFRAATSASSWQRMPVAPSVTRWISR